MKTSWGMMLWICSFGFFSCGDGLDEGFGTSRLGESCASRADCQKGLTCIDKVCVLDERTDRSCGEIEAIYLEAVKEEGTNACEKSSDCFPSDGLCNAEDELAQDSYFLNKKYQTGIEALEEEWDNNGCEQNVKCTSGIGLGSIWCLQGSCQAGGKCDQALAALCDKATSYDCEALDGSSFDCPEKIQDLLDCNPTAGDETKFYSCLSDATLDCSTLDKFLQSALDSCGTVLGLSKKP